MPRIRTENVYARVPGETKSQIQHLARAWGPIQDLSEADVIIEAVRRCWLVQQKSAGKKNRESESVPP